MSLSSRPFHSRQLSRPSLSFAAARLLVGVAGLPVLGSFIGDGKLCLNFLQRNVFAAYLIIR